MLIKPFVAKKWRRKFFIDTKGKILNKVSLLVENATTKVISYKEYTKIEQTKSEANASLFDLSRVIF